MTRLRRHGLAYYTVPGIVLSLLFDARLAGFVLAGIGVLHFFVADVIEEVKR